jgi:excisionase family DNA binding protein
MENEASPFLTVPEVARLIGASPERTYALCSDGTVPSVRFGKRVRIPRAAFERWLEDLSDRALAGTGGASRD